MDDEGQESEKISTIIGIVLLSTIAGYFWASFVSNGNGGPGEVIGFLVGIIIVLAARLAAMK